MMFGLMVKNGNDALGALLRDLKQNLLLAGKLLSVSLDFKRDQLPENIVYYI